MTTYLVYYTDSSGRRVDFYRTPSFGYAYGICERMNAVNPGENWKFETITEQGGTQPLDKAQE
jgi:hypothetical protein